MKLKQLLIMSVSALLLTGIGISAKTNIASASTARYLNNQSPRIIRYLNNRNNHCYYGYLYRRDLGELHPREHYVRGYMPKQYRHRNKRIIFFSPYYNSKAYAGNSPTLRKGRTTYYKRAIYHNANHKLYNFLCVNQHDIESHYAKRNAKYYRWAYRTIEKGNDLIADNPDDENYVYKINQKIAMARAAWGIRESNYDLFTSPKLQKAYLNPKYFPKLFKHHRRHYYRHHHSKYGRTIRIENSMANATLHDINRARENNGLSPLNYNYHSYLGQLSLRRVRQLPNDFSHDGAPDNVGENIAYVTLGNTSIAGDPHHFDNHNGKQMAHEIMDSFMNYDGNQDNVHRDNILNNDYSSIGVATLAPHGTHGNFYLVEDFQ